MTDFLLAHDAGQGAWSWGKVWGYMTAPVLHPPRLYSPRPANRVYPLDLPGHGGDSGGDTREVRFEECVNAITRAVEREGLTDVTLVGHGFSAAPLIEAAGELPQPPRRLVLLAGIIPPNGRAMSSAIPGSAKSALRVKSIVSKLSGGEQTLSRSAINNLLCNGMDPMEVVHVVGRFGPVPTKVLNARISLEPPERPYPATYVVLTRNKLVPPNLQRQMARRLPVDDVEIVEVDSCHQANLHRPREIADLLLNYA